MYDLTEVLTQINPATLAYQQWVQVGMALKQEGYDMAVWDDWSRQDSRYRNGECQRKWNTFGTSSGSVVGGGTLVQIAKENGWEAPKESYAIGWDDAIRDDGVLMAQGWMEGREVPTPSNNWNPAYEIITYLETLFDNSDNVGYVTKSFEKEGRKLPTKGVCDRTAGQLIEQLSKSGDDVGAVLGDYDPEAGAWIRFNPMDGVGVGNVNVTDYRYTLVESDTLPIEQQYAILQELELPIATLVHSGGKSLHAIVRIDATTFPEYQKRVEQLYSICKKNGFPVDEQNKNASRLSRMPGVMRGQHKQYLVATNMGKANWNEWDEWIANATDDLPDTEQLKNVWDNLPELAPSLIDGILRQGHKMLIAGPSKAGKSYALIELAISIGEGVPWMGFQCTKGRVLYVNLELDRASCLHRFKDVYTAMGIPPRHLDNIAVWNLRGKSVPMDKLAPKLIRRALKEKYMAIIIDPIYKVITGDENSADQMAAFCNQFDKICTQLGCAVIYCHHHSKGSQGNKKSMDRASGSGVFARDPDAMLDLIELDMTDALRKHQEGQAVCAVCRAWLDRGGKLGDVPDDDLHSPSKVQEACKTHLGEWSWHQMQADLDTARQRAQGLSAWRIEGTLREFPKLPPCNVWFDFPVHRVDKTGVLEDIETDVAPPTFKRNFGKKKTADERADDRKNSLEMAFQTCNMDGSVTAKSLAEYMGVNEKTVRRRLKEHGGYWIEDGNVGRKSN